MSKDYYDILQIPPSATLPEIKQAYRKLALAWHPDKNPNDPYAQAKFDEIKEAYETLTNPIRKDLYLQERWYEQSIGTKKKDITVTPVNILKLVLELDRYISTLDSHRMNRQGLALYAEELLSATTIEKLIAFHEEDINRQIITTALSSLRSLPHDLIKNLIERLKRLAGNDERSVDKIDDYIRQQKKALLWNRYKIALVILLTAIICLLIFFTSK